jgi:hypothetical protein
LGTTPFIRSKTIHTPTLRSKSNTSQSLISCRRRQIKAFPS